MHSTDAYVGCVPLVVDVAKCVDLKVINCTEYIRLHSLHKPVIILHFNLIPQDTKIPYFDGIVYVYVLVCSELSLLRTAEH